MRSVLSNRLALLAALTIATQSLVGCGGSRDAGLSNLPPVDDSRGPATYSQNSQPRKGMSTGKKVALLAGAAALYYMYKKNQESVQRGNTSEPQYYLSKNGRVYYRDKDHRAHWVTPPAEGIQVPQEEAQQYQEFQGYEGRNTGRTLAGLGNSSAF